MTVMLLSRVIWQRQQLSILRASVAELDHHLALVWQLEVLRFII